MRIAVTTLILSAASLMALGMVMLYSASMADTDTHYLLRQAIWGSLGLAVCLAGTALDYRLIKKYALPILVTGIVLLLLVYVPHIGLKSHGARRWLKLPGMSFEPSELAKLALIVALAAYGDRFHRRMGTFKFGVLFPCLIAGTTLGLIFIEPDRGTTILLTLVAGAMLVVAGMPWKFSIPLALLGVGIFAASLQHDHMRNGRINAWLHLEQHKMDTGYQSYQALLAFGSGGVDGLGLGNSREKLGFLPEHNTDFIFPIVGEELGLVGTLLVLGAYVLFIIAGMQISMNAGDHFGMLLGCGLTFLIGLQAAINIAVVTNLFPNKGLALPFISYGGSNLLMMLTSVGLLLSVSRRARPVREAAVLPVEAELVPQSA